MSDWSYNENITTYLTNVNPMLYITLIRLIFRLVPIYTESCAISRLDQINKAESHTSLIKC